MTSLQTHIGSLWDRLLTAIVPLLVFACLPLAASAQDEQCRGAPDPQCQCACKLVRTAVSIAPRGTCRVIEPASNSCQLRWLDSARGNEDKLNDPAAASRVQLQFLKRVREGELGPNREIQRDWLSVEVLIGDIKKRDRRLPRDPTPLEVAAAYLAIDPEKQHVQELLISYLIVLGPPVQAIAGDKVAAAWGRFSCFRYQEHP